MLFSKKFFLDLTTEELYEILALRSAIFVVEQNCVYQDIDGKDKEAIHIIGRNGDQIVAYARILSPGTRYVNYTSIGRIVVKEDQRAKGLGHDVVNYAIELCKKKHPKTAIKISAQSYLENFYKSHQFVETGKKYLEDGIPHMEMIYSNV